MSGYRKKLALFTAVSVLGCGVFVVHSAQPAPEESTPQKQTTNTVPSASADKYSTKDFFTKDTDLTGGSDFAGGTGELFLRTMIAVLFVIVLGVGAIYVSKRLLPRIINIQGKSIHIIETVHIGPKKSIHVIEVGNRRLLLGSTAENITKLADITDELIDLSAKQGGNI